MVLSFQSQSFCWWNNKKFKRTKYEQNMRSLEFIPEKGTEKVKV